MKFIFLLALIIAAGAQDNDSSETDDENMSTPDDDMNSNEDDMDSDEMRGIGSRSSSSGRSNKFGNDKSGMSKKMFEKLMNICVDVEFPKEMIDGMKVCAQEEAKKSSILDDILDGKFPDKKEWANMFESIEMCKLKGLGINDIDKDLTVEKFSEISMFDKWTGKQQAKEELQQKMKSCLETAEGSGFQKMISLFKCAIDYYLSNCNTEDEDPGYLILFHLKVLTLFEDSKCAPVKISDEMNTIVDECIEESKKILMNEPQTSSNPPKNKNAPKEMMKMMNLMNSFNKFVVQGLQQCIGNRTGTFDFNTRTLNVTGFADIVRKFEGWDGLEQERDAVYQAIVDCGMEYGEDSRERDNDSDAEKLKDLMEDNEDFDSCFTAKFAKICGYNNELSSMFDFLMNPELMGKLYAAFKEVGGKDVEDVITMLKDMLKKFKEQL